MNNWLMRFDGLCVLTLFAFASLGCDAKSERTPLETVEGGNTIEIVESDPVPAEEMSELVEWTKANLWSAKVIGIVDGDTIDVLNEANETIRIRVNAIDAPQRGQPFGDNAKAFASDFCFGRDVQLVGAETDRYGRVIADVFVDGESLSLALVRAGLAWHYTRFSDDETLAAAESDARDAKRGLWSDVRHVSPWEWRRLSKEERDQLR